MAYILQCLSSKCKALGSIPRTKTKQTKASQLHVATEYLKYG
jgi:hypothetical protein